MDIEGVRAQQAQVVCGTRMVGRKRRLRRGGRAPRESATLNISSRPRCSAQVSLQMEAYELQCVIPADCRRQQTRVLNAFALRRRVLPFSSQASSSARVTWYTQLTSSPVYLQVTPCPLPMRLPSSVVDSRLALCAQQANAHAALAILQLHKSINEAYKIWKRHTPFL